MISYVKLAIGLTLINFLNEVCSSMNTSRRLELKDATKEAFYHGYNSYMNHGFPFDEVMPHSCKGRGRNRTTKYFQGENDVLGDYCLTLVDSLDTLAILQDKIEFANAIQKTINFIPNFNLDSYIQVFETNIRILGGLLSAHIIATDHEDSLGMKLTEESNNILDSSGKPWVYRGELLGLARELGWRLLPAFEASINGIPYPRVNLKYGYSSEETAETCTAGAGTLLLEFATLSRLTNESAFEDVAKLAIEQLWYSRSNIDLVGNSIDILSEKWTNQMGGIAAGIDSFYEYLFKGGVYLNDADYMDIFDKAYQALLYNSRDTSAGYIFGNVNMYNSGLSAWWVDSLSAYFPGLMVQIGDVKGAERSYMIYYHMWRRYRAMPERFNLHTKSTEISFYPLRPEFVESTYFLYTATKDPFYLEVGEMVFHDINSTMRTECGFGSLRDMFKREVDDRMESFLLSETFKYLYLLFDEDNPINKGDRNSVFTTEAHYFPPLSGVDESPFQYPKESSFSTKTFLNHASPPALIRRENKHFPRLKAKLMSPHPQRTNITAIMATKVRPLKNSYTDEIAYDKLPSLKSQTMLDICPINSLYEHGKKSVLSMLHNMGSKSEIVEYIRPGAGYISVHSTKSVDYAPSLPLRSDFDLVRSLVWPYVLGVDYYEIDHKNVVHGGIIPQGEISAGKLGLEWNLQCSVPSLRDIPSLPLKYEFQNLTKIEAKDNEAHLAHLIDIIYNQANVWSLKDHIDLSSLHYLLEPYTNKSASQHYGFTSSNMYSQKMRNELDLLPLPLYSNLIKSGNSPRVASEISNIGEAGSLFEKREKVTMMLSNGSRRLTTDIVKIKLIIEVERAYHTDGYKKTKKTSKKKIALKKNYFGTKPTNHRIYKYFIGRLADFSVSDFNSNYLKVNFPINIILLPAITGSASTAFGCEKYTPLEKSAIAGKIVIVKRGGGCTFSDKANNAQSAGAAALLISMDSEIVDFFEYASEKEKTGKSKFTKDYHDYSTAALNDLWRYGGLVKISDSRPVAALLGNSKLSGNASVTQPLSITNAKHIEVELDEDTAGKQANKLNQTDKDIFEHYLQNIKMKISLPVLAVHKEFYQKVESEINEGNLVKAALW